MKPREVDRLAAELAALPGWVVTRTASGWRVKAPGRAVPIVLHRTPSDNRAWMNLRAKLRRAGWEG